MSTDLREMSALDLLRWLRDHRIRDGREALADSDVLSFAAVGVYDSEVMLRHRDAIARLYELTDFGRVEVTPPLTEADLSLLAAVGARVFRDDRDNAEDWLSVARVIEDNRDAWSERGTAAFRWYKRPAHEAIEEFIEAGRGPTYARELLAAAARLSMPPDLYNVHDRQNGLVKGYDLDVPAYVDLVTAGVTNREQLDAYLDSGLALSDAVRYASERVPPGAVVLAVRDGVPRDEWVDRYAGIRGDWVPVDREAGYTDGRAGSPRKDGALAKGYTLADLKMLADAGWADSVTVYDLAQLRWGAGRRSGGTCNLTPGMARRLAAAGLTPDDAERMLTAMSSGGRGYGDMPPLTNRYKAGDELDMAIRLHEAGVRASHLTDFRAIGCRTFEDIFRAVREGIDGRRARYLRDTYGDTRSSYDKSKRIGSLERALRHHREEGP